MKNNVNEDYRKLVYYKIFFIVWLIVWVGSLASLSMYLYSGGMFSLQVWAGYIVLAILNPGISIFKEILSKNHDKGNKGDL